MSRSHLANQVLAILLPSQLRRCFTSHMAALRTQLLLPHHARPLADILLKFISTNRAGPHGTSVLPVTLLAVIEQVQTARLSCLPLVFCALTRVCFGRLCRCWHRWPRALRLRREKTLWLWRMLKR